MGREVETEPVGTEDMEREEAAKDGNQPVSSDSNK